MRAGNPMIGEGGNEPSIDLSALTVEQAARLAERALHVGQTASWLGTDWRNRVLRALWRIVQEALADGTDAAHDVARILFDQGRCPACEGRGGWEEIPVQTGSGWDGMAAFELACRPARCPVCGRKGW